MAADFDMRLMTRWKEMFHKYENTYPRELFWHAARVCGNCGEVRDCVFLQAQTRRCGSSVNLKWNAVNWWISGNGGAVIWLDVLQAGVSAELETGPRNRRQTNLGPPQQFGCPIVFQQMPSFLFFVFFFPLSLFLSSNSSWSGRPPDDYINTFSALCSHTRLLLVTVACWPVVYFCWHVFCLNAAAVQLLRACRLFICFQSRSLDATVLFHKARILFIL